MSTSLRISGSVAALCVVFLAGCGGGSSAGTSSVNLNTQITCNEIRKLSFGNAKIITTSNSTSTTPAFCEVLAQLSDAPQTQFRLRLPENWSQRYLHLGGGAFDGFFRNLDDDSRGAATALARGFAVVTSNGGHSGNPAAPGGSAYDATWALGQPSLITDYAYRAIGSVDDAAKAIISAYYATPIKYSYFSGCSNGGREAFEAAVHYPQNYDGIIAGAPSNWGAITAQRAQIYKQIYASPANILSAGKIATVEQAELDACDALDGIKDGIISNPNACTFDPAILRCNGTDSDSCLTDAQIQTVRTLHSDTLLSDGTIIYSGFGIGSESEPSNNWQRLLFGTDDTPGLVFLLMEGALKNFYFSDSNYDWRTFDLDRDYPFLLQKATTLGLHMNATDLAPYAAMGKKLLIWNGESDYDVSAKETGRFYGELVNVFGGSTQGNCMKPC